MPERGASRVDQARERAAMRAAQGQGGARTGQGGTKAVGQPRGPARGRSRAIGILGRSGGNRLASYWTVSQGTLGHVGSPSQLTTARCMRLCLLPLRKRSPRITWRACRASRVARRSHSRREMRQHGWTTRNGRAGTERMICKTPSTISCGRWAPEGDQSRPSARWTRCSAGS